MVLAVVVLAACCLEWPFGPPGVPGTTRNTVLSVTSADSPLLKRLANECDVVYAQELTPAITSEFVLGSDHPAAAALHRAAALIADGEQLPADAPLSSPLFHAALEANIPIVLERPSADMIAALTGVGMDADAVIVETIEPDRDGDGLPMPTVSVTLLNSHASADVSGPAPGEGDDTTVTRTYEADADISMNGPNPLDLSPDAPTLVGGSDDAEALAGAIGQRLAGLAEVRRSSQKTGPWLTAGVKAAGPKWVAKLALVNKTWRPASYAQQASVGLVFTITLYSSVAPNNKFCQIQVGGVGAQTGMYSDERWNRGYFNENFAIQFEPVGTDLSMDRHAPINDNHNTAVEVSTGLIFSEDEELGPGVSYEATRTVKQDYPDFEVLDESGARRAHWGYRLYSVEGGVPIYRPAGSDPRLDAHAARAAAICTRDDSQRMRGRVFRRRRFQREGAVPLLIQPAPPERLARQVRVLLPVPRPRLRLFDFRAGREDPPGIRQVRR